ncbi:MAG: hypothetical protein AAB872_01425 [Patescibacteria group bacterium]
MKKNGQSQKIYILLIILFSLFIWRPILNQIPMGEGYYYFDRCQSQFIAPSDCPTTIWQYDNLARISFQLMIPVLKDNIHLYMFNQVGVMIVFYIVLFLVLLRISKNSFFAFSATLLFLTNHTGSFSMMAIGNYQRFVQRVPNLILILISFYFLYKYFKSDKIKNLVISILLFTAGVYLAHHSIFMLPIFIIYILLKTLTEKISLKSVVKNFVIVLSIVIIASLLTKPDHLAPKMGILTFVTETQDLTSKTLLQIPNLLIPTELVRYTAKNWPIAPVPYPFTFILQVFSIPIFIILILSLFIKTKKNNLDLLFKTAILALPIVSFLNLYAYGEGTPHPLRDFGEDRIYFISSIFSSIILAYFLYLVWNSKNKIFKFITILILISSVIYNGYLIKRDSQKLNYTSQKMESFIKYIKTKTVDKNSKIAIIGPSHLLWPTYFVDHFYNTNNNLTFSLDSSDWKIELDKNNFNQVVVLDYKNGMIIENKIK